VVTVTADEVEAVDNVEVVVVEGVVVPEVVVAGVTVVALVTATDDGWVEDVVVVVVADPVVDVVDVVDDVDDVTGAATGSSVNTSGLPAAVNVNPVEAGSVLDVVATVAG